MTADGLSTTGRSPFLNPKPPASLPNVSPPCSPVPGQGTSSQIPKLWPHLWEAGAGLAWLGVEVGGSALTKETGCRKPCWPRSKGMDGAVLCSGELGTPHNSRKPDVPASPGRSLERCFLCSTAPEPDPSWFVKNTPSSHLHALENLAHSPRPLTSSQGSRSVQQTPKPGFMDTEKAFQPFACYHSDSWHPSRDLVREPPRPVLPSAQTPKGPRNPSQDQERGSVHRRTENVAHSTRGGGTHARETQQQITYIQACEQAGLSVRTHACTHTRTHTHVYAHTHARARARMHTDLRLLCWGAAFVPSVGFH